jgi:glycosyltransferase involved in cell wall biosynthesis
LTEHAVDKVLLIGGNLEVRGSVTYTLNLARGLLKRGCEPLLLASGGPMLRAFQRSGIRVDQTDRLGKPIFDLFAFRRYLRTIASSGFKLVHVQNKSQLRQGLKAARVLNLPLIITIHHFFEPGDSLRLRKKYARGVIAVSQAVREDIVNNAKTPKELVKVVRTGVDIDSARASCTGKNRNQVPVIGTVGMLSRVKGNEYFLRAAREILDRGHEAHFLIAGQGEENSRLRRIVKDLELTRNLTFVTDFTSNLEVLRALDIFVNPSLREGLGLTVLQAMACGVPSVSTASGGIHSFVIDGETGLMAPQKDHTAIAMAVIRLMEDRDFAEKIASKASKMVEQEYNLEKMMDEVLDLYGEVVKKWEEPATA